MNSEGGLAQCILLLWSYGCMRGWFPTFWRSVVIKHHMQANAVGLLVEYGSAVVYLILIQLQHEILLSDVCCF